MRCKSDDLVIIIRGYNTRNLGMIDRLVGHRGVANDLLIHDMSGAWVIDSLHLTKGVCEEKSMTQAKGQPWTSPQADPRLALRPIHVIAH
jgi:hypothetical protein